jgi:hypothetical protein
VYLGLAGTRELDIVAPYAVAVANAFMIQNGSFG